MTTGDSMTTLTVTVPDAELENFIKGSRYLYSMRVVAAAPPTVATMQAVCRIAGEMTGNGRESTFGLRLFDIVRPYTDDATPDCKAERISCDNCHEMARLGQ